MKKYFLVFLLFTFSCIRPEKPPADVIPKDSMVSILIDLHITESMVSVKHGIPDSAQLYYEVYRQKVYDKYKIPSARFEKSFKYYMRNIEEMDKIYAVVIDSLSLREGRGKID